MKLKNCKASLLGLMFAFIAFSAQAQLLDRKAMTLAEAKKAVAAGVEEAKKNGWPVVVVVVDDAGSVLSLDRMDNAQRPSVEIAIGKARTAALFRRPSGALRASKMAILPFCIGPLLTYFHIRCAAVLTNQRFLAQPSEL